MTVDSNVIVSDMIPRPALLQSNAPQLVPAAVLLRFIVAALLIGKKGQMWN